MSHFGHFYGVSPLFLKIEGCGFRDTVLLFRKTKDAVKKIFIALLVSELQGDFETIAFWGTLCISATV